MSADYRHLPRHVAPATDELVTELARHSRLWTVLPEDADMGQWLAYCVTRLLARLAATEQPNR
ncbi:hypothetical protein ABTX81_30475 [Kitasatospora sp. NPDC097605]|uniref:hypothetical protein n=1 Tax=Kitasatospora sp. NPDC097605 TaxID=3157226 RepID=UPI003318E961